jgi:phosphodiesterase/alkaline phosphatase D-like protein
MIALAGAAGPADARTRGFSLGVTAGEITPSSARLWARANRSGTYFLQLSRGAFGGRCPRGPRVVAGPTHDNTVQLLVRGLRPETEYSYRFCAGARSSDVGRFRTAPKRSSTAAVRFGLTADLDGLYRGGRPAWNRFEVLRAMAGESFDFNVNLGDVIYSDSVFPSPHATTLRAKRAKYRLNLRYANFRRFRAATGLYSHWDDHEFINDFSVPEYGRRLYRRGAQAFREYNPVTYSRRTGIYRSFRWGANLEIFLLDLRSFRSASAGAYGRCRNPTTRRPDIAPTMPQSVRQRLAKYRPDLADPVPKACTDAIADPRRTMLGSPQFERFAHDIRSSGAAFKLILSSVPIQQFYGFPLDRWEGYEPARQRLLRFLQQNVKNVVFLSTDAHGAFTNQIFIRALESGGPVATGISEAIAGPVASLTYSGALGSAAAGRGFTTELFKPPPPAGLGMPCAQPSVNSYADTLVTPTTLSIALKDDRGEPVTDLVTGAPCPPLTVERR